MDAEFLIYALREGIKTILLIITPIMLVPMVLGLITSIIQAVTQIQDQLLNFFPKLLVIFIMIMVGTPYALSILGKYLNNILNALPNYL